jgi:cold shock CspA family protein
MTIEKGKLVRWIDNKGFGFIKPENGKSDIFIHISALAGMSRSPVIGDFILYEVSSDSNGKLRAVNAIIECVSRVSTTSITRPSSQDVTKNHKNYVSYAPKPKKRFNSLLILFVIVAAIYLYDKFYKNINLNIAPKLPEFHTQVIEQKERFQCQGKVWCTEMSSLEEALFYLKNCPGTKIDGDNDGEPCEEQFR